MMIHLFDFVVILLLILLNGILAATEIAVISASYPQLELRARKSPRAQIALRLKKNPGVFFSTIQVGITLVGIVSGVFSGQRFAEPLGLYLSRLPLFGSAGNAIAFGGIVVFVTYISIVLGELFPKKIAVSNPEAVAVLFAPPIEKLAKLAYPLVRFLDVSSAALLKPFRHSSQNPPVITQDEVRMIVRRGLQEGSIDAFEHGLFRKALLFGDLRASALMTPWIKVVALDLKDGYRANMEKILASAHRYYPVFEGNKKNFKGILDTKSVCRKMAGQKRVNMRALLQQVPFVFEDTLGQDVLKSFKKYKTHIALVADEYASIKGIITLVDIFETLVGVMPEAQTDKHYKITKRKDGSLLCDGLTPVDKLLDFINPEGASATALMDSDTLAGFFLGQFKETPREGDSISWNGFRFEVMDMDGMRIDKLLVQKESD